MDRHDDETDVVRIHARSVRRERLLSMVISVVLVLAIAVILGGCASSSGGGYSAGEERMAPATMQPTQGEGKLGIRMEGLRLSAAGNILDFRYRVLDPELAAPLLNRKIRPYLLDEASGAQLGVPDTAKLGQLRTTGRNKVMAEQNYFILFANPGRIVQAGNRMTLVMGDLRIENLVVQ